MGLKRSNLAKAVMAAFKALGDIPESVTLRTVTSTYDTSTSTNTKTTSDQTIDEAVFTRYSKVEIDRVSVLSKDVKCIFQQSEVDAEPNIATDKVVRGDRTYNIISVEEDPASVIWILQLRSP